MKTKIYSLVAAAMLTLGACTDNWERPVAEEGSLQFTSCSVDPDEIVKVVMGAPSRAEEVNTDNFIITIYDPQGKTGDDLTWTYSTIPEVLRLPVGKGYTMIVESHKIKPAAWDEPYYKGTATFDINHNKITRLGDIVCHFSSLKVSVTFSKDLLDNLSADSKVTVYKSESSDVLVFGLDETRAGYFDIPEGSTSMVAMLDGVLFGDPYNETKISNQLEVGKHFVFNFKLLTPPTPPQPTGTTAPSFAIDWDVEEVGLNHTVGVTEETLPDNDRPGGQEPEGPDDPNIPDDPVPAATFEPEGVVLNAPNYYPTDVSEAIVYITCPNKFQKLEVAIDSEILSPELLEEVELGSKFDLCNPGASKAKIDELLKINSGEDLKTKTELKFDVTSFLSMLKALGNGSSTFTITVTDSQGKSASTKLIIVTVEE